MAISESNSGGDSLMGFERLNLWWFFLLLLGVYFIHLFLWLKKRKKIFSAKNLKILERKGAILLGEISVLLGIIFLSIALFSPTWGEGKKKIEASGSDMVFILDLSNSMLCEDSPPSRLKAAKSLISQLVIRGKGDRFAIIGFAGEARIFSPLTSSKDGFLKILDFLGPEVVKQGTNIGVGLKKGLGLLSGSVKRGKVIIILTDGEFNTGRWGEEAVALGKEGIRTFIVGIGTKEGGGIKMSDGTFKRDNLGREVLTALRPETLEKLSSDLKADLLILESLSPIEVVKRIESRAEKVSRFHYITYSVPRYYIFTFLFFLSILGFIYWRRR